MRALVLSLSLLPPSSVMPSLLPQPSSSASQCLSFGNVICNVPNYWSDTDDDLLSSQNTILRSSGQIILVNKAGGSWCTRLACDSGSNGDVGIYACNDAANNVTIDGSAVADFAEAIINTTACTSSVRQGKKTWHHVKGQAFNNAASWNVILGMADGES
ncbi:hypothetical protein N0V93_005606 [Gnomoniopsis smithogilvyi]|uniref:Cyanovirin-N domain-containing protein n=1 Tax=Gnomoniopsis smithogilvyi TaxID=1191159 RepID=A0A9W9CYB1_9PEZI|nr:hypothetical protein N0V93_005606 [Gnomoniopsis smithogilvyi]